MDNKYYEALVRLRMERAAELLEEAKRLLKDGSFKSANNRAYYSIEKAVNALLVDKHIEVSTHNGAMKMFNMEYVRPENAFFTQEDYRCISKSERVRNASDYDDFYVTSKSECEQQVMSAEAFLKKTKEYFEENGCR